MLDCAVKVWLRRSVQMSAALERLCPINKPHPVQCIKQEYQLTVFMSQVFFFLYMKKII